MDSELAQAIGMINAQIAQGRLQLDRDIYQNIQLPTYRDINFPTSVGANTGFLPGDYAGGYGGMPTFGALTGTAGMFGYAGTDPRWAALGYGPGQETMGGRQLGGAEAQRDTELGMQYGGQFVGGSAVPDWMQPHLAWAQNYARTHQGQAPTQEQLTGGVAGSVNQALAGLRSDPTYQASSGNRRRELEAQAVASATNLNPQQAAGVIADLRQQTANTGAPSTAQQVVEAVGRWQNPQDPASSVNAAMTRLRQDPTYQAAGGDQRRAMEASSIAQATGLGLQQAQGVVADLRAGSAGSGSLSANQAIAAALQRQTQGPFVQRTQPVLYGQQPNQVDGGMQQGGQGSPLDQYRAGAGPSTGAGGPTPMGEIVDDATYAARHPGWTPPTNLPAGYRPPAAGGARMELLGADRGPQAFGGFARQAQGFGAPQRFGGIPSVGGGVNYGGSGLAGQGYGTTAMSPQQRALIEQGRQFDVSSQLGQRAQDVAMRGQDITQQGQLSDAALRALQIEGSLRADPFALERYRRGLGQTGIPNVISAVAGQGILPGVQASQGRPLPPGLGEAVGALTGGPRFGAPAAGAQAQLAALPQLNQINPRNYLRAGAGGQNYVNSAYRAVGMAGSDEDVTEAVRRGLPQFARRGVPTFGRVA